VEKVRLIQLEGTEHGPTLVLTRLPATIGSDPEVDVLLAGTAPRHAVIFRRGRDVVLIDSGSSSGTWLAGETVQEAVLHDGDVLELGAGGPRLEFHDDAKSARAPRPHALSETMAFRLARRTSTAFRVAMAVGAVAGAALLYASWREGQRVKGEVADLRQALSRGEQERRDLERRVAAERRRADQEGRALQDTVEGFRRREEELTGRLSAAAATGDVETLKGELTSTRERLATLESERAAGERIIREYGAGVCLIQGSYAFYDKTGRPLRYGAAQAQSAEGTGQGEDEASLEADGDGAIHTVDYYGTGFLVAGDGLVLTNRHVAEPWWNDTTAEALRQKGFEPRFVLLRAFFPREKEPIELVFERRSDKADVALLRAQLKGRRVPVLPLERQAQRTVPGQPVVVVGYPTGLEAILAKTESGVVASILEFHGTDSERVTEALSQKGLIRPSTTQGHIGDVTGSDIVFDAPTSQGGSGGPVFNKHGQVIAVEYAVLPKFGGNSFGVPIAYAIDLLKAR
jgi:S1-C subfamily serine protease